MCVKYIWVNEHPAMCVEFERMQIENCQISDIATICTYKYFGVEMYKYVTLRVYMFIDTCAYVYVT